MNSLVEKSAFLGLEDCTWLFNGAETPPHRGVMQAMQDYVNVRARGPRGREENSRIEQQCRSQIASLLHGRSEDIALVSNASEAITMIAHALKLEPGDNVVIHSLEFPSGVYPWLLLRERGIEVRLVEHQNWQVSVEDVLERVDLRTRLVLTSHVSFVSGARFDYRQLYSQLKNTNTLLLLDVTQSLGVVPVHMYEADIVVCSSYKWLLSVHGLGILGINSERVGDLMPASAGWRGVTDIFGSDRFESFSFPDSAKRFELGYPSFPTIYALNYSSGLLLDTGIERIEQHILNLGAELIERLLKLDLEVITPVKREARGGNIAFLCPAAEQMTEALLRDNVYVWGGDGRIRASVHLYNDMTDIERFIQVFTKIHSKA